MRSAEMLVWMGDFNYRIDLDYDTVVQLVRNYVKGNDRNALAHLLQEVRSRIQHHDWGEPSAG